MKGQFILLILFAYICAFLLYVYTFIAGIYIFWPNISWSNTNILEVIDIRVYILNFWLSQILSIWLKAVPITIYWLMRLQFIISEIIDCGIKMLISHDWIIFRPSKFYIVIMNFFIFTFFIKFGLILFVLISQNIFDFILFCWTIWLSIIARLFNYLFKLYLSMFTFVLSFFILKW